QYTPRLGATTGAARRRGCLGWLEDELCGETATNLTAIFIDRHGQKPACENLTSCPLLAGGWATRHSGDIRKSIGALQALSNKPQVPGTRLRTLSPARHATPFQR